MEEEQLLKRIQDWTNSIPLIILGSGASIPHNLPSMSDLAEHLENYLNFTDPADVNQFNEFRGKLIVNKDLEAALQDIQLRPKVLEEIVDKTWNFINERDLEAFERIIHFDCTFPLAELLKHLINTAQRKVSIITTNYDRIAEYAASFTNAFICCGFIQNFFGGFSNGINNQDLSKLKGFSGQIDIWKVHGSLDWFRTKQEQDVYLPNRKSIPIDYHPLIVTPGISKYSETHKEPFRTIFTKMDTEIEKAHHFLCIGYGFNDIHVQPKLITQIKSGKPIIVITKQLTEKIKQTIIGNGCKNYILIEQAGSKDSKVYIPGEEVLLEELEYWKLSEFVKLIIN